MANIIYNFLETHVSIFLGLLVMSIQLPLTSSRHARGLLLHLPGLPSWHAQCRVALMAAQRSLAASWQWDFSTICRSTVSQANHGFSTSMQTFTLYHHEKFRHSFFILFCPCWDNCQKSATYVWFQLEHAAKYLAKLNSCVCFTNLQAKFWI